MDNPAKDIVVDSDVICLYDAPSNPLFRPLFIWLAEIGTLTVSQKLLTEYYGNGNRLLAGLIDRLSREGRLARVSKQELEGFRQDRHYNYTCNHKDKWHAKLVFLSKRKLLVSQDNRLIRDINEFRKISGIKPKASKAPTPDFYE